MNRKRKGQQRAEHEHLEANLVRSALINTYRLIDRVRGNVNPRVTNGFGWVHVDTTKTS